MQNDERIESGGVTFDAAALDALLDDDPNVGVEKPNDLDTGVGEVPGESASQDEKFEDGVPRGDDGLDSRSADESESLADDAEAVDSVDEGDEQAGDRSDDQVEGEEFITDGDEGPLLLTGIGEDGKPIFESAEQLFGDHQFRIKAAGEDHEVTFQEMRQGYQRQADYTRAKTEVVQMQRQLQPFMKLVNMWNESDQFRDIVSNFIKGSETADISDEAVLEAFDSGDRDKVTKLIEQKKVARERKQAYEAANRATNEQRMAYAEEQHRIANSIIDDYTNTIPNVKTFLTSLGYGDNEVEGLEYADARLQNLAYLAFKQTNPDSSRAIHTKPEQALRSKRRMIVKRPPKPVTAGAGTSNTPNANKARQARAAYQKAYKSRKDSDIQQAIALTLPEDLLED